VFNSFPYDSWLDDAGNLNQEIAEFWTWGGGGSTGTWILTILGFAAMLIAFWGFVILENRKLTTQADRLKASGALDRPGTAT
jgi:hypothetical protein